MSRIHKNWIKLDSLGFCIKSRDWTVRWQNEACKKACGDKQGSSCRRNCRLWCVENEALDRAGATLFGYKEIDGKRYDVVVISGDEEIVTLLCPVGRSEEETTRFLEGLGLTPREIQILKLKLEGESHGDISAALGISQSTLKSHLKNIRTKTAEAGSAQALEQMMKRKRA